MFDIVRQQLARTVPFARLLGIAVDRLDGEGATSRLEQAAHLNNHVGTLHAGAVFTACEAASGAALAGSLLPVIMQTRFVVREARIGYLKPALGVLSATASVGKPTPAILEELQRTGRCEVTVDVRASTTGDDGHALHVADASFAWHLRLNEA